MSTATTTPSFWCRAAVVVGAIAVLQQLSGADAYLLPALPSCVSRNAASSSSAFNLGAKQPQAMGLEQSWTYAATTHSHSQLRARPVPRPSAMPDAPPATGQQPWPLAPGPWPLAAHASPLTVPAIPFGLQIPIPITD